MEYSDFSITKVESLTTISLQPTRLALPRRVT
ncbi:hypothetical protein KGM_200800 [Danaus plexippus plexippus]|uniref:Uncharacterized protein n=1 Tax=Danaus plexippus plexippus TaxID=278856 RepID=A0A212ES00_DANPL|nr:hypothetical protein KGM_200800 [Danaus plexippus plexippus]